MTVNVNEPLQEYIQYASIIKSILKFRHQKHIQSESTADQLESRRSSLENLEKMEQEAKRIEDALKKGRSPTSDSFSSVNSTLHDGSSTDDRPITDTAFTKDPESIEDDDEPRNPFANATSESTSSFAQPPTSQTNPYAHTHSTTPSNPKRRSTRLNVFSALSHTIHGIIDVDPEATRRSNIGRTKDAIVQVSIAPVSGILWTANVHGSINIPALTSVCNDSWRSSWRLRMQTWTRFRGPYKEIWIASSAKRSGI